MKRISTLLLSILFVGFIAPAAQADWKADLLGQLVVKAESKSSTYKRAAFKHWIDADRDKCDTRSEVLIEESIEKPQISKQCKVTIGRWVSAYDQKTIYVAGLLDIDHLVPLKEAWESGASAWSNARRQAFANDLEYSGSLIAVTASTNRSKGDKDPASWLPPARNVICSYAVTWIAVKYRWDLSIDAKEKSGLSRALSTCADNGYFTLPAKPGKPSTTKSFGTLPSTDSSETSPTSAAPEPTGSPQKSYGSELFPGVFALEVVTDYRVIAGQDVTVKATLKDVYGVLVEGASVEYSIDNSTYTAGPSDSTGVIEFRIPTSASTVAGSIMIMFKSGFSTRFKTVIIDRTVLPSQSPSPSQTSTPSPTATDGTTSYRLVSPGAFCSKSDAGSTGKSSSGQLYTCKTSSTENRLRWRR